jgi:hypothetical protein
MTFTIVAMTATTGGGASQQSSDILSQGEAIRVMRAVNTAEGSAHMRGGYEPLSSLTASDNVLGTVVTAEGAVKNYILRIVVDDTRHHYQASLRPARQTCEAALFTDDLGVIYIGNGLGCR